MEWVLKASKEVYQELVGFGYDISYQSEINGFDDADHYWKRLSDLLQHHDLDFEINHGASKMMPWGCIISEGPGYACYICDGKLYSGVYQHILNTTFRDTMKYYSFDWSNIYF
ncbi:hypothetical protein G6F48_013560 [Rhizopus delemar]|nr:hypothetical protein G6F48_013560 [Rhizopus delemar]